MHKISIILWAFLMPALLAAQDSVTTKPEMDEAEFGSRPSIQKEFKDSESEKEAEGESGEEEASDAELNNKFSEMSRMDARKFLKDSLITNDIGDTVLPPFPKFDLKAIDDYENLSFARNYLPYIYYFDRNMNLEEISKAIERRAKRRSDGGKTYNMPIVFSAFNDYLGRKNMAFQEIGFQSNNIRTRIENGMPVFCLFVRSPDLNTTVTERTEERSNATDTDEWIKIVRQSDKSNIDTKVPDNYLVFGIITGINRKTGEFLVINAARRPIWLTNKEINRLVKSAYSVRF